MLHTNYRCTLAIEAFCLQLESVSEHINMRPPNSKATGLSKGFSAASPSRCWIFWAFFFCIGHPKCWVLTFKGFSCKDMLISLSVRPIFAGFFRFPFYLQVIYTSGLEDFLQRPSEGAWIFTQWPSKHCEFPMFFRDDVQHTCWISCHQCFRA